ncbi:hypothetical protein KIW84_020136 [Lathyrus oleraceus]|uniref:Vesicle transport protein n=1 Tax=Pisum sativum TaxID=3888 RepID=A0A9D4Y4W6_PEA|nr:hypothetical protein KIW84_020136 [Pisum sativum]
MEGWFSSSTSPSDDQQKPASSSSSSLLADWNSYATSQQEQDPSNSAISFDLESAVRSANNSVTGTFSVGSHSHWGFYAVWLAPFMYLWCYIATFSLLYSLLYRFFHLDTMLYHIYSVSS